MLQVRDRHFFQQIGGGGLGGGLGGLTSCNSPSSTLRSVIILAVPESYDEPVVVTDTMNDDICSLERRILRFNSGGIFLRRRL